MIEIIGWVGASLLLLSYALLSSKKISGQSLNYQLMNFGGSACLLTNAYFNGAWPFVLLNAVWAIVGIVTLSRIILIK